jgi:hypothetical protein
VAVLSKAWVCGPLIAVTAGSNYTQGRMLVSWGLLCDVQVAGLCDKLIVISERTYCVVCVSLCVIWQP